MDTNVDEIADGIFRISTWIEEIAPPAGFSFNQFVVRGEEPLLFHTGPRQMFPLVAEAVSRVVPVESLRWITFGHVESDECGSMNDWLVAAPNSTIAHGMIGCLVSLNDMADRPPRPLEDGEVLDLGGKRVRHLDTPHVPHGWEARVLYEETTSTLLCGDLFSAVGNGPPVSTDDPLGPAAIAEDMFGATALTATTGAQIRGLAELQPQTLAIMHGSSYSGDGGAALLGLADDYDQRAQSAASA
jgi:flavorubredoxin